MISGNILKGENGSFSLFSKTGKCLNENFQEVLNDESSNTGVESESIAETLKAVKSGT